MLNILIFLIFLILIIIIALCITEKTRLGGLEIRRDQTVKTEYPLDKYAYLFDHLTKQNYETALLYSELKYTLRKIRIGETYQQIGLTKKQYDLIVKFNKAFRSSPGMDVDGYSTLMNYEIFKNLKPEYKVLSVGAQHYVHIKNNKFPVAKHDLVLFAVHNRDDSAMYTQILKEKTHLYDNFYGSYAAKNQTKEGKLELINELDKITEQYDLINFMYFDITDDYYNRGPIVANEQFEYIFIGVLKALKHLKIGGKLIMVINLAFMVPIVESLFNLLAASFESYLITRAKNRIIITFSALKMAINAEYKIEYRTVPYLFYVEETSLIPYSCDIVAKKSPIIDNIDNCLILYFSELNTVFFDIEASIDNMIYDNIRLTVDLYKKRGIPYDEYYVDIVTDYYKQVYTELISINDSIRSAIMHMGTKNLKLNALTYEDKFSYKLSMYPTTNDNLAIGNELWEIFYTFRLLSPQIMAFHIGEDVEIFKKIVKYNHCDKYTYDIVTDIISFNYDKYKNSKNLLTCDVKCTKITEICKTLMMGGNCVIKCVTPYQKDFNSIKDFIDLISSFYKQFDKLYLFKPCASCPLNGEFYIIGMNYKPKTDQYETSNEFEIQINSFLEKVVNLNIKTLTRQRYLSHITMDMSEINQNQLKVWENLFDYV